MQISDYPHIEGRVNPRGNHNNSLNDFYENRNVIG